MSEERMGKPITPADAGVYADNPTQLTPIAEEARKTFLRSMRSILTERLSSADSLVKPEDVGQYDKEK
ncbi:MAG: hypothetical protein ACD_37C00071G0002 [uncultured bacterium]|nr:MAG: hypothetical protein ACD_37C00071G0002 [uncultured bacterium]